MAITNFIPELWSAQLLTSYKKSLVFGSSAVVNRDYEGEITAKGDTVRITSVGRPTISDYTKNGSLSGPETLTDAERSLAITQSKAFNFEIDDIDKRQAVNGGALMAEAASEAAYGMADVADQYIAGLWTGADSANALGTVSITTSALAITGLINLRTVLSAASVPPAGRYVIVPAWYYGLLLGSDLFVRADASGTTEGLREGYVGRAFGFDVYESNNCVNSTGDDWVVQAGTPRAITMAEQIVKTEAYRPEASFSDALKGLQVYGAKLVRPKGIATMVASIT